jgi:hypothetical protein
MAVACRLQLYSSEVEEVLAPGRAALGFFKRMPCVHYKAFMLAFVAC